jgi:hypothetical protein
MLSQLFDRMGIHITAVASEVRGFQSGTAMMGNRNTDSMTCRRWYTMLPQISDGQT